MKFADYFYKPGVHKFASARGTRMSSLPKWGTKGRRGRAASSRAMVVYAPPTRRAPGRTRAPNRTRVAVTREVARQMNRVAENRYIGAHKECIKPTPKPAGDQLISYVLLNSGQTLPTGVSSSFTPMDLFTYPQADRTGRYLYVKSASCKFNIQTVPVEADNLNLLATPINFRMIVVKQKQYNNRLGNVSSPDRSLFLSPDNESFGLQDTTKFEQEYQMQPINKRHWMVYKDQRFTLQPPATNIVDSQGTTVQNTTNTATGGRFPAVKNFNISLPLNAKVLYEDGDHPLDIDSQFLIIIQAIPESHCAPDVTEPNARWRVNYISSTQANDS